MIKKIIDMFPDEFDQSKDSCNETAIIPIGSVEQHGPHLLLGCDSFIAEALARQTVEIHGGVLFPLIPYSWIGGLRAWPGTMDIRSKNMANYIEDVCLSIIKNGFKKLLLVNCHGGGREMVFLAAQRVTKKTGIPVLSIFTGRIHRREEIKSIWEKYGLGGRESDHEGSELLGALKSLNREELMSKVKSEANMLAYEFSGSIRDPRIESLKEVFKISEVGYNFTGEAQHVFPHKSIDERAGYEVQVESAKILSEALKSLDDLK